MKYFLLIQLILFSLFLLGPQKTQAQVPISQAPFFCVGTNLRPPCITRAPSPSQPFVSSSPSTNPSVSANPTGANLNPTTTVKPSQNPSPTLNPCANQKDSVTEQSSGSRHHHRHKSHVSGQRGLLQQLLQLLLQLLQLLFQQLGTKFPTPTPCPTPSPSSSPSVSPSVSAAPSGTSTSPSPSKAPTPTIFGTSPTPSSSPSPSSSASPSPSSSTSASPSTSPSTSGTPAKPGKAGSLQSLLPAGTSTTTKLCMDDRGNGTADNNPVQSWACNNNKAQLWTPYSDNTIRINGKCLDVNKSGTTNNTAVNIFTCNGGKNQQWKLTKITSGANKGKTELLGVQSNRCLDISKNSTANGTQLEIFTCNGGDNQVWSWTNTGSGNGATVTNSGLLQSNTSAGTSNTTKLCLDDKAGSTTAGNSVITWACNNADNAQQWKGYSDGTIRFSGDTTKCLDVLKQATAMRTKVDLYTCNGGANQVWTLTPIATGQAKGKTELKSKQSGLCLDITGQSTANGTQLEIFTCNGGNNQAWSWTSGGTSPKPANWSYLAPTNLHKVSTTSTQVVVAWDKVTGSSPTVPGGVPAPGSYTVAAYTTKGSLIKQNTTTTTTDTVSGLVKNSTVVIHVWANGGPVAPPHASLTVNL